MSKEKIKFFRYTSPAVAVISLLSLDKAQALSAKIYKCNGLHYKLSFRGTTSRPSPVQSKLNTPCRPNTCVQSSCSKLISVTLDLNCTLTKGVGHLVRCKKVAGFQSKVVSSENLLSKMIRLRQQIQNQIRALGLTNSGDKIETEIAPQHREAIGQVKKTLLLCDITLKLVSSELGKTYFPSDESLTHLDESNLTDAQRSILSEHNSLIKQVLKQLSQAKKTLEKI